MVIGHTGNTGFFEALFYSFHMPAFFMISGYLYRPKPFVNTLKSLGIPLLIFFVFNVGWHIPMLVKHEVNIHETVGGIMSRLLYSDMEYNYFVGMWFIIVLILLRMISGDLPIFSFVSKNKGIIIVATLTLMIGESFFEFGNNKVTLSHIYKVIYCLPFFLCGLILKENGERLLNLSPSHLIILAACWLSITWMNGRIDLAYHNFEISYITSFFNALIASVWFFNICKRIPNNKGQKVIEKISIGTFFILGIHIFILFLMKICLKQFGLENYDGLLAIILATITIAISYPLIIYCQKHYPILLGKLHIQKQSVPILNS